MRPSIPSVILSRRAKIVLSVVAIIVVLLILLVKFAGVYVNFLWYSQLGHRNVYSTVLWTRVALFFIFGVLMVLIICGNMLLAYRLRPPFRPMSPEQQNLQHYVAMVEPRRKLLLAVVGVLILLSEGASAQGDWQTWLLWLNGGSFGMKDPQFHRDISFYAFDYNAYRAMLSFGFTAIIVSLLISIGIHYLAGAIRLQTPGPKVTLSARRHLTVLVFVFMALKAVAYWLDRYGLVFSQRSKFTGANYTDVHSALPAKTILFWIAVVLAIGVLASLWLRSALLPGIGFVVLLVLSILIGGIYPAIVQHLTVNPNASDKERPYIEKNILATRQAYGIVTDNGKNGGSVDYVTYQANTSPQPSAITVTNTTVDNIRILDPNVISPTVSNSQKIGLPYAFSSKLDVDRYSIPDATGKSVQHDYVVAVREQATGSNLSGSQDNWINQHTVYTHGYGFVAAQADQDVTNGADYTESDIPPVGPLDNTQPDVYYGQLMNDYSIVGAKGAHREFDANNGAKVTYTGKGGVSLSNPFTKLAFALKYKETNFILNDAVSAPGAKIIFNRNPKTMLQRVAPFLTVDGDPYPIVDSKTHHIVWMLDGYTTMANFPYSERQSLSDLTGTTLRQDQSDTQINYIRNSVKATVDAYDGTIKLYDWDTKDPVLNAWKKIFPGLVKPEKDMPAQIKAHVRYPQDLFDVQRALLAQYHISNPVDSYNAAGKWAVPVDPFSPGAGDQPSYYVLASPPGSSSNTPQFQLTTPMLVNSGNNLAAYISANSDPSSPDYGKLTVLQVPGKSNYNGPGQVANDLKSEATISKDITQLDAGQSTVLHGNLLTLPVGNAFLYVEPLYVESTGSSSAFPTLQRVLVRYGDKIGYSDTLDKALGEIRSGAVAGSSLSTLGSTSTGTGTGTPTAAPTSSAPPVSSSSTAPTSSPTTPTTGGPTSVNTLLSQLATANQQLNSAYDSHDPTRIAQAQANELKIVQQLLKARTPTK
ncbi:UPF0182 family protein [uncultured Jatrophihabitans sp.]|uniref:UPF0182 family membrane protein n=1 Tax=uncultured Jatrophihabitans sp. TaxID=1610747 RepID=UPI0035CB674A